MLLMYYIKVMIAMNSSHLLQNIR